MSVASRLQCTFLCCLSALRTFAQFPAAICPFTMNIAATVTHANAAHPACCVIAAAQGADAQRRTAHSRTSCMAPCRRCRDDWLIRRTFRTSKI